MDTVQITLNAENKGVVEILRSLLLQMKGVSNVSISIDNDFDITSTPAYQEAIEDIASGRVYRAANAKEMFAQILD
ncbi:MAG: response regulator [Bacteroidales bacterium]|nr:response regulator [Bacteroidales bacterium]